MPDEPDSNQFSESEIIAMRYAYRELLGEHLERFVTVSARENLARSVVESLAHMKSIVVEDIAEVMSLILAVDE